jgi:hypothetical protein
MSTIGTIVVATALVTAAILMMVCVSAALTQKDQTESERFIA